MARPNIVLESKGRNTYERLLSSEEMSDMKNVEIDRLDDRKSYAKITTIATGSTPTTKAFYFTIFNDDQSNTETYTLNLYKMIPTGFTIDITVEGIAKLDGSSIVVAPNGMAKGVITFSRTNATAIEGECAFLILKVSIEESTTNCDVIKAICVIEPVTQVDIETDMEQITDDEVIFPVTATYSKATVIAELIDKRTRELIGMVLPRINSYTIPQYTDVRDGIINRVKRDLYWKFIIMSISGGNEFLNTVKSLDNDYASILSRITYNADPDW